MRFGWHVENFKQDSAGVELTAVHAGAAQDWRAQYLVGCDGGRSLVRRTVGIKFRGEAGLEIRPGLAARIGAGQEREHDCANGGEKLHPRFVCAQNRRTNDAGQRDKAAPCLGAGI
jgi:2-polyprenyl-6-methoxyphenol hydroxylase-like FAD-dependent oxidoreductase